MFQRSYFLLPVFCVVSSIASQAVADVAPPATYVEECTIEKKQTATTECLACKASRASVPANRCTVLLAPYGYAHSCDTWGGTIYVELWCRSTNPDAPVVPDCIKPQLSTYDAPKLEGTAGAPGSCSTTSGGFAGTPSAASGGSNAGSGGAVPASGGAPAAISSNVGPNLDHSKSESACAFAPAQSKSGSWSLVILAMLGLGCWIGRKKSG